MDGSSDILMLPKVFTGRHPFSEFTSPVTTSKIVGGERPARPREVQGQGLTDSVWDVTVRCWHEDPAQRPMMTEVVKLMCEWPVFSLSPHGMTIITHFLQLQDGGYLED